MIPPVFRTVTGLPRPALALTLAVGLACPGMAAAQTASDSPVRMPNWAVLVLQPVGDKRVKPVTGIVVSDDGAVVVPADFGAPGDVLIVLDGGTDVIDHGRAATVRAHDPAAGVAVLDVQGLSRTPARLAARAPEAGDTLRFAAFPPAEQIAEGAAPLIQSVQAAELLDATADPLPNVSGPLLDRCGNLAGYTIAGGLPSMQPSEETRLTWSEKLVAALGAVGVDVATGTCGQQAEAASETPADEALPAAPAAAAPVVEREPNGEMDTAPARLPAAVTGTEDQWHWAWIAAAAGIVVLAFLAWRFGRRRTVAPGLLQDTVVRRSARTERGEAAVPAGGASAGWTLELQGQLAGGAAFTRRCPVNPAAIDVVIGSGTGDSGHAADIVIEAPGIGREHARLGGSAGALTISDLGGPGGTWIGRVPCLRGEVMFVTDGDTVALGETSFTVRLVPPGSPEE